MIVGGDHESIINEIDAIDVDSKEYVPQDQTRVKVVFSKQVPRIVTKQVPRIVTKQVPRIVTKQVPRIVTKQVQTPYTALVPDYINESGWEYVQGAGYHTYQKNYNNDNSTPNSNYDVWITRRNNDNDLITGVWPVKEHKVFEGYDEYDNEIYTTIIDAFRVFIRASRVTTETRYNTTTVQETVYDTVNETVYDTVNETVYDTVNETVYDTVIDDARILKYIDLESVMASEGWTSVQILNNYLTYQDLNEIGIYI